ncbi:MAG: TonB-dependent receptor [Pseudomonadales bacterium]|jgi:outer membrane receptor protein involved in Fe transport|nr:TonB-dependent receptor [Pseudomonadales bacterium]
MIRTTSSSSTRNKLCLAVATATLATFNIASAQQNAAPLEEIQVTGTRIRVVDGMSAPTPVTAMSVEELKTFDPGGSVASQLDSLPQFFGTNTAQRGGSVLTTGGGSYLNLRGMGQNRTLVVLDGTRVAPADAQGGVNVDLFPGSLVQRVDVVTGGASAAYGADAVAGVVNFILDREFEGLKASVSSGITQLGDGANYNLSVTGGKGFMDGRLHAIGSVETRHIDQIGPQSKDRLDSWKDWGLVRNPAYKATDPPGTNPLRITVPYVFGNQSAPQGKIITTATNFPYTNWVFTDNGKDIRPYDNGAYFSNSGAGNQNNQSGGQEYKYFDAQSQRGPGGNEVVQRTGFMGLKFDASDRLFITLQAAFGRSESNRYGLHSNASISGPVYAWKVFRDNVYLPERLAQAMDAAGLDMVKFSPIGVVDGPGLINIYDNRGDRAIQAQQMYTASFDFAIDDNWKLNGAYQHGATRIDTGMLNIPRTDKLFLAMDAVRDPATGQIVCNIALRNPQPAELAAFMVGKKLSSPSDVNGVTANSPVGPLNPKECVPFNPFGLGNATQAAKDWIVEEGKKQVRTLNQDFAELLLTGVVYEGWGAGPVSLAAGLTWRDEKFDQINYPEWGERSVLNAPELGIRAIPDGFAGDGNRELHPFSGVGSGGGSKSVWEYYGELNVPLWEWSTGQRLGSSFSYRSSSYSQAGRQSSWKIGLDAQLLDSLRWRITKSSDIREPNFAETFLSGTGGGSVNDPFRNNEANGSLTVLANANLDLLPEIGDTITSGLVWQPTFAEWIDGLSVSVDWYEINLKGAITTYGAQRIVDDCRAGVATACNLIVRDVPNNGFAVGPITRILNMYINADMAQTRGVDFEASYRFSPNFFGNGDETFSLRTLVGYLGENSTTTAAGATQDSARSRTRPELTGLISGTYGIGSLSFMLQGHYFDRVMNNNTWVSGVDIDDNWIASQTTFNTGLTYRSEMKSGGTWRAAFNITNLFNREPSVAPGAGGQGLITGHDVLGRRYQVSLNMDF